jgi:hypothetical protein
MLIGTATDGFSLNEPVRIDDSARARHVYILGQTGTGKSIALENMAAQAIQNGEGVCFLDPHGQSAEALISQIPKARADHLIYIDLAHTETVPSLNFMTDFDNQFFTRAYSETKIQITQRINAVVKVPAFRRMIGTPENRFDLYTLMERGSIIFVNTSKNLLGKKGSAFFGRWIMSLVIRAAYERMRDTNPRQTLILVDEASDYTDTLFEELLEKVRQFQVGCLLAFQGTHQFRASKAILSLTAVKLCGLVEHDDAQIMAPQLRTNPDFLKALLFKENVGTQFACFVRGVSQETTTVPVNFTIFDNQPQMSAPQYEQLLQNNRERFGVRAQHPAPRKHTAAPDAPPPAPTPASKPHPPAGVDLDAPRKPKRDW